MKVPLSLSRAAFVWTVQFPLSCPSPAAPSGRKSSHVVSPVWSPSSRQWDRHSCSLGRGWPLSLSHCHLCPHPCTSRGPCEAALSLLAWCQCLFSLLTLVWFWGLNPLPWLQILWYTAGDSKEGKNTTWCLAPTQTNAKILLKKLRFYKF